MLLSVLLFTFPAIDKPIDFRPDVGTAPNVVALLAKQSGLRLKSNANVANDVVAVVAPNQNPREIMDKVAHAIEAEWKEEGGEWTLFRSDDVLREQARRDREETIKQIKAGIDRIADPGEFTAASVADQIEGYTRRPASGQNSDSYAKVRDTMPDRRLLIRFLKGTSPEVFALPLGSRVVFSTTPTRMQQPMPAAFAPLLQKFEAEQEALFQAWPMPKEPTYTPFPRPARHTISKVNAVVTRLGLGSLTVRLVAYNPAGNHAFDAVRTIPNEIAAFAPPGRMGADEKLVDLRPLSRELLKIAIPSLADQFASPGPELRAHIEHPKGHDPLALANTEAFQAIATEESKPLVAAVPESLLYAVASSTLDGKVSIGRFRKCLAEMGTVRVEQDGWICYREGNPALGRLRRVDRAAWDAHYRRIARDGRAGLDAFADFVRRHPGPLEYTLYPLHQATFGVPRSTYTYGDDLNVVRLYGSLDSQQREILKAQRYIPLDSFSTTQVGYLSKIYYSGVQHRINFSSEPGAPEAHPQRGIYTEPTECYPDGLKAPFKVGGVVMEFPSVMRRTAAGELAPTAPESLAWEAFQRERPELFPWADGARGHLAGPYIEGQVRNWEFIFRVSPNLIFSNTLSDNFATSNLERRLDQLPEAFRDRMKAQLEELRVQYRDARPGEVTRRSPPPP